ncbi:Chitin synthase, class 2 [Entophlyctis sp. JEL0112]|nr:Chitin synthase, class 2 [Entophlyctis sp. JEL0112]
MGNSIVNNPGISHDVSEDPFWGHGVFIFMAFKELYLYAIILVFLSSLGNRPQGSKMLYTICFLLFAIIMASLLYITGYSLYRSFPQSLEEFATRLDSPTQAPILINMIISLICTYGVYFLASIVYMDPWHMVTSMMQYLLLVPSFINILMVYACEFNSSYRIN